MTFARPIARYHSRRHWFPRLLIHSIPFAAALVLLIGLLGIHSYLETDPGELAVWGTSLVWMAWTAFAAGVNWEIWYDLRGPDEQDMKAIALRRVRNQFFQLSIASIVWISTSITLFYDLGEVQSAIRTYTLVVASVLFSYRSVLDHMEQRSIDYKGFDAEPMIPPLGRSEDGGR